MYAVGGLDKGGNPSYFVFSLEALAGAKYWREEPCLIRARWGAAAEVLCRPLYLRGISPPPPSDEDAA